MKKFIKDYFLKKKNEIRSYGKKNIIIRLVTIVLTIAFASLVIIAFTRSGFYKNDNTIDYTEKIFRKLEKAKVIEVISVEENNNPSIEYTYHITYKILLLSGEDEGKECIAHQYLNDYTSNFYNTVKKGKIIYASRQLNATGDATYIFNGDSVSFDHIGGLIILSIILIVLLLIISKSKGLLTIISLVLTVLSIVLLFLPGIIFGENIYILTILICLYIIIVTFLLVVGINKKGVCASLGCIGGLLLSGLLTIISMKLLSATGYFAAEDIEDVTLLFQTLYNADIKIDLKGLVFSTTLIGALGAVMDVSLSLSSSLKEVYDNAKETSMINTIKSGFVIGKDMIGTMVNTLILAYIASDSAFILYMMVHHSNAFIFRSEYIALAIAQALIGSIAMVLTIPLTSIICALIYNKRREKGEGHEEN